LTLVEDGRSEVDDLLNERIADLKVKRERAHSALERARSGRGTAADDRPILIERFTRNMRERLSAGPVPARKALLGSLIDRVEVDDREVRTWLRQLTPQFLRHVLDCLRGVVLQANRAPHPRHDIVEEALYAVLQRGLRHRSSIKGKAQDDAPGHPFELVLDLRGEVGQGLFADRTDDADTQLRALDLKSE
jgi:hypothetical protein